MGKKIIIEICDETLKFRVFKGDKEIVDLPDQKGVEWAIKGMLATLNQNDPSILTLPSIPKKNN